MSIKKKKERPLNFINGHSLGFILEIANDGATAPVSCLLDLMMWDATDRMALITQPLLMMTGEKSDSRYMTEEAMEKATGTQEKEMFIVPGASHIKTYYEPAFVEQERAKVVAFFDKYLAKP